MEFMFVCIGLLFASFIPVLIMEVFVRAQLMRIREYNLEHANKTHQFVV